MQQLHRQLVASFPSLSGHVCDAAWSTLAVAQLCKQGQMKDSHQCRGYHCDEACARAMQQNQAGSSEVVGKSEAVQR